MGGMNKKVKASATPIQRFKIGGQEMALIPISRIKPNPWNPNKMDAETFEKEKASITEFGMVDPILVRRAGKGWEIVDGEHRYRASIELGFTEILCVDLGDVDDQKAKKLTIIANELRGSSDPNDLARLVADLASKESTEDLARLLPHTQVELESMMASLRSYDIPDEAFSGVGTDLDGLLAPPSLVGLGKEFRVQLGPVRGTVPEAGFRALLEEWNNSAQHIGSKNVELVVADLCDRLRGVRRPDRPSPPVAPESAVLADSDAANGTPKARGKARKARAGESVQ